MTAILAKELMQEDTPPSSKPPNKKAKQAEQKEQSPMEGAESLEDLLEDSPSRSH